MKKRNQKVIACFRKFLLLLFFLSIHFTAASQDLGLEFGERQEVSGSFTIFQDSSGFMWFGQQLGLTRFDGFEYKTYMNAPFDENSLTGNAVYSLLEDSFGNFWVGTGEDLCLFDREKGRYWKVNSGQRINSKRG